MSRLQDLSSSRKDTKRSADPKVANTVKTLANMKKETPYLKDLSSQLTKYHSYLVGLASCGKAISEILDKIADCHEGELQDSLKTIAAIHKGLDDGRVRIAEAMMGGVIVPIGARCKEDHKEALAFASAYKKQRGAGLSVIRKAESRAKKAQKRSRKNPNRFDEALSTLETAITNHDDYLANSFREAKLLERKRCCALISGYVEIIEAETEVLGIAWDDLNSSKDVLSAIAGDTDNVGDTDRVIEESKPNKNLEQLREARKTGYYDSSEMAYLQDSLRMSSAHLGDSMAASPRSSGPPPPMGGPPPPTNGPPSSSPSSTPALPSRGNSSAPSLPNRTSTQYDAGTGESDYY